jgi:tetratricopeptide (TPR) repeat protein
MVLMIRTGVASPTSRRVVFTAIALLPALNIVPLPRFSSPHYGYFAAIVFGAAIVFVLKKAGAWANTYRRLIQTATVSWIIIAAFTTWSHGSYFKNDLTLFEPEVVRDDHFLEGHFYLGDYFAQRGDLQRAGNAYRAALTFDPNVLAYLDRSSAMINYAGVLLKQGKPAEAEKLLARVSGNVSVPEQRLVDYNLALVANQRREFIRVVDLLAKHREAWQRPEPLLMLATALRQLQRTQEAVEALRVALPYLDPQQRAKAMALIEASKKAPK